MHHNLMNTTEHVYLPLQLYVVVTGYKLYLFLFVVLTLVTML